MNLKPEDAVGVHIAVNGGRYRGPVAGVVKDFHDRSFHDDITPIFIASQLDMYNVYAIKIKPADIQSTVKAIQEKWSAAYPELIFEYQFMDDQVAEFYKTEDTMMKIIRLFCSVAIFVGCIGLYGLVSYMANRKTKEIGIRKVFGSSVAQILWIFGREFGLLIVVSFILAAPVGALLMSQWLQGFKYKITIGPSVFLLTIVATAIVCFLAVFLQSFRAASQSPASSLRSE
jgi:ABC-type antimicrobial peptide transport system permease subunit